MEQISGRGLAADAEPAGSRVCTKSAQMLIPKYLLMAAVGFFTCGAAATLAASYPTKAIRMLDGFPPGGGTDFLSRTLGQKITESWGQSVIIDNRPGASSNIG